MRLTRLRAGVALRVDVCGHAARAAKPPIHHQQKGGVFNRIAFARREIDV
jgi:hypothetical protein